MPQSFPDAKTLLVAATKYMEDELMPTLDGYHRFKVRVTINVLTPSVASWKCVKGRPARSSETGRRSSATKATSKR